MNLVLKSRVNDCQLQSPPGHDIRTYPPGSPRVPPAPPGGGGSHLSRVEVTL